uniref:IgGFc-binding protein-like n=1 Tax=Panagrellus redivivus TaxID=6233 RepID=A0A7E4VHL1_PANRE
MHRTFPIVALIMVVVAVSGETIGQYKRGFWTRVRGQLLCRGGYIETWASLKTAKHPAQELVSVYAHYGQFDMMSHADNGGVFSPLLPPVSPGFLVSVKADCGCGGEHFDLPLVPAANQYHYTPLYAVNNPYDYGKTEKNQMAVKQAGIRIRPNLGARAHGHVLRVVLASGGSPVTTTTKKPTTTPTTRKPGQGCQKDADCTASTLHVCNLQTGVCGPLTCKFNDSSLTVDPCSEVLFCHVLPDLGAGSQQHVCRNYIIIAERNIDHTFTVKGFGAAVSKTHFLSSVSSGFAKYGNSELYVIVAGYGIHQLRAADVFPQMNIGSFNVNAWQDLVLVKLPAGTTLVFHFEVKKTAPGPQDKLTTLRLSGDKLNLGAIQLQPDAECEKMFRLDETIQYVPNSNMACGLDANDRGTRLMNGAPLAVGTYVYGIRSVASLDPGHKNGFLVTKLAPNCDWLFRASEGAVKCV